MGSRLMNSMCLLLGYLINQGSFLLRAIQAVLMNKNIQHQTVILYSLTWKVILIKLHWGTTTLWNVVRPTPINFSFCQRRFPSRYTHQSENVRTFDLLQSSVVLTFSSNSVLSFTSYKTCQCFRDSVILGIAGGLVEKQISGRKQKAA